MPETLSNFAQYADYYDLLYAGKDYGQEVGYVHDHIQLFHPGAKSLLDLGCGTGRHLSGFVDLGYQVTGIDLSGQMLALAKERLGHDQGVTLLEGDARTVRLRRRFDVVVSLFHVMSYQLNNEDIAQVFETARAHLKKGGLFLFDCWYGPGVLTDRPIERIKQFEDDKSRIIRKSVPEMHAENNAVDVSFEVEVLSKNTGKKVHLDELHRMRYLFSPEVRQAFDAAGFEVVIEEEWISGKKLSYDSWNGFFGGMFR